MVSCQIFCCESYSLESALLYLNLDSSQLSPELLDHFQSHNITIRPYGAFFGDLQKILEVSSSKFMIDPVTTNDAIWRYEKTVDFFISKFFCSALPHARCLPLDHSPIEKMKANKNQDELHGMKACHIRDGLACSHLLWELFRNYSNNLTEIIISEKISSYRKSYSPASYLYPSFETIAGVGPNGAIVHYRLNFDKSIVHSRVVPNQIHLAL